ncbi:hypothetical protein HL658_30920 [Azospirillum sp. RWY-5-1]|uniref:Autotransporter domain-containing protein n=1 Tax=Azospirillum oleiclasticum TaxID=2735135 RepID=A0ABX2TLJ2_9PROT|nr:hypothetical protein [Azospirillum oleiclasticum]NYZ16977.1 hypothetical protein [Azospirillum oleiclasticum]NYZ24580.1 hypothetical protein [Azospirillum oleiclasticum]
MTTLVATGNVPINMTTATLSNLPSASITISTANQIRASWSSTAWVDFYGSFTYPNGGIAGTLNRAIEVTGGVAAYDMSGISIDAGTFLGWVNSGATTTAKRAIFGGNDIIYGTRYTDSFEYWGGSDYIDGGGGGDVLKISDGYTYNNTSPEMVALREGEFYRLITKGGEIVMKSVGSIYYNSFYATTLSSLIFDATAYSAANRDLAVAFGTNTVAAARHYMNYGRAEGRSTSGFDPMQYLAANGDVQAAFGINAGSALSHWLTNGAREGRSASFNTLGYLASNGDLLRAFGTNLSSAVQHYLAFGRGEGRTTTSFNGAAYLAANPDVARAGFTAANAASHYVYYGFREGRPLSRAALAAG